MAKDDNQIGTIELATPPQTSYFKTALHEFGDLEGIKVHQVPSKSLSQWTVPKQYEVGLVASFGYFLPRKIIDSFSKCILNAHPSLLPKFRGPSPIHHTILSRDKESGVSIISLDKDVFDAGMIYSQRKIEISPSTFYSELRDTLATLSGEMFSQVTQNYELYQALAYKQDSSQVTSASKIKSEDSNVIFVKESRDIIWAKHRAFSHTNSVQGHLSEIQKYVKILEICDPLYFDGPTNMDLENWTKLSNSAQVGSTYYERKTNLLWIKCADGKWLAAKNFRVQDKPQLFTAGSLIGSYTLKNFIKHFN